MNKIGKYVANQVLTASPVELVLMLFDEAIRSLKKADTAFALDTPARFELINKHLTHTQDVIRELLYSLNMEKGGEVAKNLDRLYAFMLVHLTQSNVQKNPQPAAEVREMLTTLREAWQVVLEKELAQETKDTPARLHTAHNHILAAG